MEKQNETGLYDLFSSIVEDVGEKRFEMVMNYKTMKGKRLTVEGLSIRNLTSGQAIKFPCRWNHKRGNTGCSGIMLAHKNAERSNFKVNATCHESFLYVRRVPDAN